MFSRSKLINFVHKSGSNLITWTSESVVSKNIPIVFNKCYSSDAPVKPQISPKILITGDYF